MSRATTASRMQSRGSPPRGTRKSGRWQRWTRRAIAILLIVLLPLPVSHLLIFRFVPVPITPEIVLKLLTFQPVHQRWVPFAAISPNLARAVLASEDENFCRHHGFDWKSIDDALKSHKRHPHKPLRG